MNIWIFLIVLLLLFGGGGYSYQRRTDWGYAPFGSFGFVILVIVLLYFFGRP